MSVTARKNSSGFTLVEVIVVAVIVAILAAVAIPIYIGYVNDSAQNVVNNLATDLSTAAGAAANYQFSGTVTIAAPTTTADGKITWPKGSFPTALSNDITFKIPKGVTYDGNLTSGNLQTTGVTCVLTYRTKNATANW
jgi:prepilin-type N-terminal cleavage/methylation domain-containing protein